MEKLNIAEILKDCPKGMELYSPLCGKCVFDRVCFGTIVCTRQNKQNITFTNKGYYMLPVSDDCECMIFPSKENRDWSTFQKPFKEGDIAVTEKGHIHLLRTKDSSYCAYREEWKGLPPFDPTITTDVKVVRLATKEEKQKFFDIIKANGYKWNNETKTLERLPKFKVGDRVRGKYTNNIYTISCVTLTEYKLTNGGSFTFDVEDCFKLVSNKFDIFTLKPFDKVLVRYGNNIWHIHFFEKYDKSLKYPFVCMNGNCYKQCIPYENNEHLLDTTNDCNDFYKTWK